MLRHYDAIGLLVPDRVDATSGYRSYSPEQLHLLNRLVALKDLGFTLDQVRGLLVDPPGPDELRGMLRLRRAELEEEARAVGTRLTAVESRLRMIEKENTVSPDYVVKTLPALRLLGSRTVHDMESGPPPVGPMFDEARAGFEAAGVEPGLPVATYGGAPDDLMEIVVGFVSADPLAGLEVFDLPEASGVCGVHLGAMDQIQESWQALHRWIADNGYGFEGPCREVYVKTDMDTQDTWVTELQQPVTT